MPPTSTHNLSEVLPYRNGGDVPLPQADGNSTWSLGQSDLPGSEILFYVKARREYTATASDDFSFKEGDVIAVTSAGDDVWWSGDLVDETRREEGRRFFHRTHVSMVQSAAGDPLRRKLFYVKGRVDYTGHCASELSFKKDDVIAVVQVGDSGWWRGEHYHDSRREEGREWFPNTCVTPAYN
ncbi:hypothetical protein H0H92_013706, partial [Tricholoma furcatifolium]